MFSLAFCCFGSSLFINRDGVAAKHFKKDNCNRKATEKPGKTLKNALSRFPFYQNLSILCSDSNHSRLSG